MNRALAIAIAAALATQAVPAAPAHHYASLSDGWFAYARRPSPDERSLGVKSMRPLKVRYLGRDQAGAYRFLLDNNGLILWTACNAPCTVMRASAGLSAFRAPPTMDARDPSILHAVFLDAEAGRLDVAISGPMGEYPPNPNAQRAERPSPPASLPDNP